MRKLSIALLIAGALAIGAVPAAAKQDAPGTPGERNCQGQTTAFLAQVGKTIPLVGKGGIGNLARAAELTPKEVHEVVRTFCAGP